jgi:hypothetical protein
MKLSNQVAMSTSDRRIRFLIQAATNDLIQATEECKITLNTGMQIRIKKITKLILTIPSHLNTEEVSGIIFPVRHFVIEINAQCRYILPWYVLQCPNLKRLTIKGRKVPQIFIDRLYQNLECFTHS